MYSIERTKLVRMKFYIAILVLFLGTIELSLANKSCKNTVMKMVLRQCSDASFRSEKDLDSSTISPIGKKIDYRSLPKTDTLPLAQAHTLGFDLTATELEELLHEINARLGRNPAAGNEEIANKIKQSFLQIAARCCQNENECLKEKIIDCP